MSQIDDAHDKLQSAWTRLQDEWSQVRTEWRDSVADRFEREHWNEWEQALPQLLRSVAELDEVVGDALRRTQQ